eukprot:TRINITY_DN8194_c0_g3_i1.p1 TRINITY_DN8194_c0_g3~~TRINITY_DN8194_c0_g3_i1.p1  ORF type:complete len:135 (-),score=20.54 TRINITY_DN8194_c0_g3_i1:34-390(-)
MCIRDRFSDVGLVSLSRFLPTLTRIQELSIHWYVNENTSDDGCCQMTNAISSLSSLSYLQLHLLAYLDSYHEVYYSITDRTMKSMCTMLHSLLTVSHLDLSLYAVSYTHLTLPTIYSV